MAALLGELAIGYLQQIHETTLEQQEQIRSACLTELRQAERTLRIKDASIDASINACALSDLEGTLIYVNQAFLTSWGYGAPEDVLGRSAETLWRSREKGAEVLQALWESGSWVGELVAERADGSVFDALLSASMIKDRAGRPVRIVGSFIDITDRKRAQTALAEHVERLEALREIDRAILAGQSLQDVAQTAVRHIERLLPCEVASLAVFDRDGGTATLILVRQGDEDPPGPPKSLSLDGLDDAMEVLQQGKALFREELLDLFGAPPAIEAIQPPESRSLMVVPLISGDALIGTLNLAAHREGAFCTEDLPVVQAVADSLAIAVQHDQQREQISNLPTRLAEAEEAERHRVAHRLHDHAGQQLTGAALTLSLAQTYLDHENWEDVRSRLEDAMLLIEETAVSIRDLTAELRPPMLDELGLVPTLRWSGDRFSFRTGVPVTVQDLQPLPRLPMHIERTLFRIAQEALNNASKHAKATQVTISVWSDEEVVHMAVVDDGVGFDPDQLREAGRRSVRLGLISMQERAETLGGRCHIESRVGHGTRVVVEVPR
jgi:PAS domain S-box-containing protein